jgi:uncharacterized protein YndB with AHSA1/START domain
MPKAETTATEPKRMSDEAVRAKTGRTWPEWFAILDAAGARQWSHKQIVAYLSQEHGVGPWWQQSVTVGYEQARGLRELHEMPGGYQISVSKTIAAPAEALFDAWMDEATRARWLPDATFTARKATPGKSIRAAWADGTTSLDIQFYRKGENKTQVTAQHNKLAGGDEAERMKEYWRAALDRLKTLLER